MKIDDFIDKYDRVAIVGGPVTGKSWITDRYKKSRRVIHTDGLPMDGFGDKAMALKGHAEKHKKFIVAGICTDLAIKKGLEVDAIIHCTEVRGTRYNNGQRTLKKQVDKRVRLLKGTKPYMEFREEDQYEAPPGIPIPRKG